MRLVSPRVLGAVALLTAVGIAVSAEAGRGRTLYGNEEMIGAGSVRSFLTLDGSGKPIAIGVTMFPGALDSLPEHPNTVSRCFDLDGNGQHTAHECIGDEERILEVPSSGSLGIPFQWIGLNWNPAGHHAPYARPHFDFHFHTGPRDRIEAIRAGRCGELADCADFKRATQAVPRQYIPAGYIDVGAVVARMGNHLLDSRSPELKDSLPFTSTFIYGAYEGEVIFWEPMITLDFLRQTREACLEIRQPEAFRTAGYYPTQYCVRQGSNGDRTVSLERFRYAEAG